MRSAGDPVTVSLDRVSSLIQRRHEHRASEHGISAAQARLLDVLRDGAPTINELAALLATDKSSASGLVDRAAQRGLVRRVPSQLDRRSVRVRLTDRGSALQRQVSDVFAGDIEAMLAPLAVGDRDVLASLLNALAAG